MCIRDSVWTDVKSGMVSLEAGPRMASADEFHITVKGKGCHGAQPERGVDAAVVTAAIINNLQSVVSREISPMDPAVVTVGTIQAGTRWNVAVSYTHLDVYKRQGFMGLRVLNTATRGFFSSS